jgi:hypothetical protein
VAIEWSDPPWQPVAEPALAAPLDYTQLPYLALAPPPQAVDPLVKLAQTLLNAAGWTPPLTVDGRFGPLTRDAVIWHQARALIVPTGEIDPDTWLTLAASAPQPRLEPGPGTPPMAGPPIAFVQELLNEAGAHPALAVDGSFDQATRDRLREFQRSRGVPETGVVDPATWFALGNVHLDEGELVALRLTYQFDQSWWTQPDEPPVRLAMIEVVETTAPPSAPLDPLGPLAGAWVEVWDEQNRPIYRRFLYDPFRRTRELLPGEPGEVLSRVPASPEDARGELEVVVPYQARSVAVAIFSSPLEPPLPDQPAGLIWVDRL